MSWEDDVLNSIDDYFGILILVGIVIGAVVFAVCYKPEPKITPAMVAAFGWQKLSQDIWDECHPHCGSKYDQVPNICVIHNWVCQKERP